MTYFAAPSLAEFAPERFPVWIWMDDPCFYGFPVFGEPGPKVGQDAGGQEVTADTRTFDVDEPARDRVVRFLERYLPSALGPVLYTKTCLYTLTPDRDFVIDTVPGRPEIAVAIGGGHGFKFASLVGRILSELAIDGRTPHDHLRVPAGPSDPADGEPSDQLHGVTAPAPAAPREEAPARLHRVMGFRDLLLFYLVTGFTVRWVGTAASAGPSAVVIWLLGLRRVLHPADVHRAGALVAVPQRGRRVRVEQARLRRFRGVHHRLDLLGLQPAVLPGPLLLHRRERALHRRPELAGALGRAGVLHHLLAAGAGWWPPALNVRGLNVGKWLHNLGAVGLWIPGAAARWGWASYR